MAETKLELQHRELIDAIPNDAVTHSGSFHSDDVYATAFLQILKPELKVSRVSKVPEGYQGLVYDIGGGEFDHHQKDKRYRENRIPYAAFGLLWEKYGVCVVSERDAQRFDEQFIQDMDLSDNTGSRNMIAESVAAFNPGWNTDENPDEMFFQAVAVAKQILLRQFITMNCKEQATKEVKRIMEEQGAGRLLELKEHIPWKDAVYKTDVYYVLYPSNRGGFMVQAVADDYKAPICKLPFPKAWRGQPQEVLEEVSGIRGLRFCHPSGFLCGTDSYGAARAVAKFMIERIGK